MVDCTYRGVDRRNILAGSARSVTPRTIVALELAALGIPVLVGLVARSEVPASRLVAMASVGASVAFILSGVLLLMRWRLLGEAASGLLAPVAVVFGLVIVPTSVAVPRWIDHRMAVVAPERVLAVCVVLVLVTCAAFAPDVLADLHPVRVGSAILSVIGVCGALVWLFPSAIDTVVAQGGNAVVIGEATLAGLGAAVLLRKALSSHRALHAVVGVALTTTAAAYVILVSSAAGAGGALLSVPALLFLESGAILLLVTTGDLASAVAVNEVRARRRWEAAETELAVMFQAQRGREHDISGSLGAISNALTLVQQDSDRLGAGQVDRLLGAMYEQVQWLQSLMLVDAERSECLYDVFQLAAVAADLRSGQPQRVTVTAQPGLFVLGHPGRIAMVIHNLLANAAAYAPGSEVWVTAGRSAGDGGETIDIDISDLGPGLSADDCLRAVAPGWRGRSASEVPGSGLGLYQCVELVRAEGGTLALGPTRSTGQGVTGLRVCLRLPAAASVTPPPLGSSNSR